MWCALCGLWARRALVLFVGLCACWLCGERAPQVLFVWCLRVLVVRRTCTSLPSPRSARTSSGCTSRGSTGCTAGGARGDRGAGAFFARVHLPPVTPQMGFIRPPVFRANSCIQPSPLSPCWMRELASARPGADGRKGLCPSRPSPFQHVTSKRSVEQRAGWLRDDPRRICCPS